MKNLLSRIWFPAAVVLVAAVQSFGVELSRRFVPEEPSPSQDTVKYSNRRTFTRYRDAADRIASVDTLDSLGVDSLELNDTTLHLSARDTIIPPDSLREKDPFRYKYYVAIYDSLTHVQVMDSLKAEGDTLAYTMLDSIYNLELAIRKKAEFEAWYNSLDKDARKKYDFQQKMKRKLAIVDSTLAVKDSLMDIRDSIKEYTPRILESFSVPDSMQYKRILSWTRDNEFNMVELHEIDTTFNYRFHDLPFFRDDVNASYLGISGSAAQHFDFFQRNYTEDVSFYRPYEVYSYSPATLPMYNTKTPYTELAYYGTLFADTQNEENNLHLMTTQNIYPSLNLRLEYDRYGANGLLENEKTDNRTFIASANWLGKKYQAHLGYIYNKIGRNENGGIKDTYWIRDTLVGAREIDVYLDNASSLIKKNTVFLDQTYRIPFSFIKDLMHRKKPSKAEADSSAMAESDSLALASADSLTSASDTLETMAQADTILIDKDVTTAFFGHSSEYSVYTRSYQDEIGTSDTDGRNFYNNTFLINPTKSSDSLRVMKFDNKVYARLQPWASDGIVSSLNVGLGDRLMKFYLPVQNMYLMQPNDATWNSVYLYGGAEGQYRKFVNWNAKGYYTFLGNEINDVGLEANAGIDLYPFRRHRKSPLSLDVHFETKLDEPDFYEQHYFSNHYQWENEFSKISTSKIEGTLRIPHFNLEIAAGYSLLSNNIFYDTLGVVRQNPDPMSVAKLSVQKNFKVGILHFDNRVLFQVSSNEDVMPLPKVALNLRYYIQFNVKKDILKMQIGADGTYNTSWYAPAYNPAIGQFHNQTKEKFGDCPYVDLFVNMQWKRACVFIKYLNANMGWPNDSADYFSASGYIRPQRALKFGVYWPFYKQTKKNVQMSSKLGGGSQ